MTAQAASEHSVVKHFLQGSDASLTLVLSSELLILRIPEATIEEIRRRTDILDVCRAFNIELKKAGNNTYKACCPFHQEKTPSFNINPSKQVYHCFGCGVGGGVFHLVESLLNSDFVGAMRWLADHYGITIPQENYENSREGARRRETHDNGMKLLDELAGFYQSCLSSPQGAEARSYLANRGLDEETIRKYRLGYAPVSREETCGWALKRGYSADLLVATGVAIQRDDPSRRIFDRWNNRIMFPICDELGRVVGFSGRVFGPNPPQNVGKYVNSPESDFFHKGRILYGFQFARTALGKAGRGLVCEGQLDVIACHRAGVQEAFAAQGTAFTEDHARMLSRTGVPRIDLAFDGDAAGMKATLRTLSILLAAGLDVGVILLPQGEDPDSLFQKGGASAIQKVMGAPQPAIPYVLRKFTEAHPNGTPEDKSAIVTQMLEILAAIPNEITAYGYCQELAKNLNVPEQIVVGQLKRRKAVQAQEEARQRQYAYGAPRRPGVATMEGYVPEAQPEAGVREAPKTLFHDLHGTQALAETMLDLCLHFPEAAENWQDLRMDELLSPENPVVQALNFILASTAEQDWEGAVQQVMQGDMASDPAVSKLLTVSLYDDQQRNPDGSLPAVVLQAMQDCQKRLEILQLEDRQRKLSRKMAEASPFDDDLQMLRQAKEMAQQRATLRQRPNSQ